MNKEFNIYEMLANRLLSSEEKKRFQELNSKTKGELNESEEQEFKRLLINVLRRYRRKAREYRFKKK